MKTTGRLIYDPALVKSTKTRNDPFWLIVECDPEISRYYRYWVYKELYVKLLRPAWGAHISVIRGERPTKPELWKKYVGQKIFIEYSPEVETNERHYWLDVDCPFLLDLREELGLKRNPYYKLHMTIGNLPGEEE